MQIYDYIVIGGGSGGIASANRAGMHGAKAFAPCIPALFAEAIPPEPPPITM